MAQVECRSDSEYAQRPIAFYYRKRRFEVGSLLAEWHEPEGKAFRVMTEEMEIFISGFKFHLSANKEIVFHIFYKLRGIPRNL